MGKLHFALAMGGILIAIIGLVIGMTYAIGHIFDRIMRAERDWYED